MEAKDLMIGDWVVYEGDTEYRDPIRVEGMDIATNSLITSDRDDVGFDGIWPIPLTPEILEANGFTRGKVFVEWEYEDDNIYMLWKPFPWIKIEAENHTVMFPCVFVHELQHALRLCGINKEIKI